MRVMREYTLCVVAKLRTHDHDGEWKRLLERARARYDSTLHFRRVCAFRLGRGGASY